MDLTPQELDAQSPIKIDRWLDVDSQEWRDMDDDPGLTKKFLRLGFQEPPFFFTDALGRVWGKGEDGRFYPFHFNIGKKLYGYRISKKAVN